MSKKQVLVQGFYGKANLGDELFKNAFQFLFPELDFAFVDKITTDSLLGADAVFIGGGSLLDQPLFIDNGYLPIWKKLSSLPLFYIGVGAETDIHKQHQQFMSKAKLVALRSEARIDEVKALNPNVIVIPDLVYALVPCVSSVKIPNSVLVMPNISVVPSWNDPNWKHAAWGYFKSEFAQFLDSLIETGNRVDFLPLCTNPKLNDAHAAQEIINFMSRRGRHIHHEQASFEKSTQLISQYETMITQRFHGIVLANMCQVPALALWHHDKLREDSVDNLSYYGLTKSQLHQSFFRVAQKKSESIQPIKRDRYELLTQAVMNALCPDQERQDHIDY